MPCILLCPHVFLFSGLSAETQLLHDGPVSLDVHFLKIVQKLTALADQAKKATTGYHVFLVLLHMLGKVSDTVSGEPVSLLDFPYFAKISCFFSGCKYSAMMQ